MDRFKQQPRILTCALRPCHATSNHSAHTKLEYNVSNQEPKKDTIPTPAQPASKPIETKTQSALSTTQRWLYGLYGSLAGIFIFFVGIWLLPTPSYKTGFRTLTELQEHAATLDEWIKMENDNELLPSYEEYYTKTFTPSFWAQWREKLTWVLSRIHLVSPPPFSSSFFATLLKNVLDYRIKQQWTDDCIQKITINPTSKIIVFGVIQGAYHSLVRDLTELKRLNIIDEHLRLKNNDYYMVFLGNVVNRSPYTLDTFSVVLRLMQENPQNIIYLRGTNEFFDYWKDHTLRRELEVRCKKLSKEKIPLASEVNKLFSTLPITLYGMLPTWSPSDMLYYIRLSAFIGDKRLLSMLHEPTYASFLSAPQLQALDTFDLKKRSAQPEPQAEKILLRAVVRDIMKRESYEKTDGLKLLPPQSGDICWHVLSAPTQPYRGAFYFTNDAFAIIEPHSSNLYNFTITLNYKAPNSSIFHVRQELLFNTHQ